MSTNPNNAIGTNGAYGGRTSVDALNDVLNIFTGGGIARGWECVPSSGMTVSLGGVTGHRDVAIAVSPTGSRTTINNRTSSAVNVTIDTAPSTNSRIDLIVAYAQNPPQGTTTVVDNPAACGIIAVKGTVSSSPTAPSDSDIRAAITADGATGSTAYYVILASIRVVAGLTTITSDYITQGARATLGTSSIANGAITSDKIDFTTLPLLIAQNTTTFTPPMGTNYYPTLPTIIKNTGGFVVSGSEITIPDDGEYTINVNMVALNSGGLRFDLVIVVNNSETYGQSFSQEYGKASITCDYSLAAGDVVKVLMLNNSTVQNCPVQKLNVSVKRI